MSSFGSASCSLFLLFVGGRLPLAARPFLPHCSARRVGAAARPAAYTTLRTWPRSWRTPRPGVSGSVWTPHAYALAHAVRTPNGERTLGMLARGRRRAAGGPRETHQRPRETGAG